MGAGLKLNFGAMIENNSTPWDRIQLILESTKAKNVNSFAANIGIKRGENLYQIKRGNNGISKTLAEQIRQAYPQFSLTWLLTGEGTPLIPEQFNEIHRIPFFENLTSADSEPSAFFDISPNLCRGAEFATICRDNALHPKIPQGSYLLLRKCRHIIFGDAYLIQTDDFWILRIIRKGQPKENISLTSIQPNFDSFEIAENAIKSLYKICAVITDLTY